MTHEITYPGRVTFGDIRTELIRKSIHMMIAFVPAFAKYNISLTMMILAFGVVFYTYAEMLRMQGRTVGLITRITVAASRKRDQNGLLLGPVTLGIGTMLALMLYPEPAAAIAIYALAFGDGFSSLFGKIFGKIHIPFTGGKTFAGSFACLISVFIIGYSISRSLTASVLIAFTATFLEVIPTKDFDNIIIPVGTGLVAVACMGV